MFSEFVIEHVYDRADGAYHRAFFDFFLERNILGQILDLLAVPYTPKVRIGVVIGMKTPRR